MKAVFGAILALGISSCGPAYADETAVPTAQPPAECISPAQKMERARVSSPNVQNLHYGLTATGADKDAFIAVIKAHYGSPAPDVFKYSDVVTIRVLTGDNADIDRVLFFSKDDCVIGQLDVPAGTVQTMLMGSPA